MNTKEKDSIIIVSIVITALLFSVILGCIWLYSPDAFNYVNEMKFNDWGDFLGGTFGTVALFWLILGYMLQKQELQQNTKALELQAEELKNTVEEYKHMVEINRRQLDVLNAPQLFVNLSLSMEKDNISLAIIKLNIKNSGGSACNVKISLADYEIDLEKINRGDEISKCFNQIDIVEKNIITLNSNIGESNFKDTYSLSYQYIFDNEITDSKIEKLVEYDSSALDILKTINRIC
ncbi:hypothetical protein [Gilliamella sp. wkB171]|uniref:hypothetical protein n=1 Tax=Gilliamella sp. wkB171 TaxID=3120258 RepID=UPI0008131AAE|nr:hypothetical protein [Gilliamella apicola]OCL19730.1 hypothetical protein A9G03_08520 [Gilliamella apicola]